MELYRYQMNMIPLRGVDVLCGFSAIGLAFIVFKKLLFPSHTSLLTAPDGTRSLVPKGSFGLPYIGETVQFAMSDPVAFCKPRMEKYGKVFKTRLLGIPTIIVTCPDLAKYIFTDRRHQFTYAYPLHVENLLGKGTGLPPEVELRAHRAAFSFFSTDALRKKLPDIESMASNTLFSWAAQGSVKSVTSECIKFTMKVAIYLILGLKPDDQLTLKLQDYYQIYADGLQCLPIKLPGTQYSRALKAKKNIENELEVFMRKRIASGMKRSDRNSTDLLDVFLDCTCDDKGHNGSRLSMDIIPRLLRLSLFAARELLGYTITWAIKLLQESPEALQAVTMENDAIRRRKGVGEPLTWADFKDMKYTLHVIQESLRISSVASGPTRTAVEDVHYRGHAIPKGWYVMIRLPAIHKNADYFPDPMRFDPSRFEKPQKPNTFMPFGGGRHSCTGVELAKLEMFVILHLLTTQFTWARVGEDAGIINHPWPVPRDGLPITIKVKGPSDSDGKTVAGVF